MARSMTLQELATAHALARELSVPLPDPARISMLRSALGLPDREHGTDRQARNR